MAAEQQQQHEGPARHDMVDAAVRFMSGQKVRETPIEEQTKFLKNKGLSDEEIRLAREKADAELSLMVTTPAVASAGGSSNTALYHHPQQMNYYAPQPSSRWRDVANSVVLVGGLSYAGYKLLRKWVLPRFFGVPDADEERERRMEEQVNELQNSLKFVIDSVQQTHRGVQDQQDSLNRALVLLAEKDVTTGHGAQKFNELRNDVAVIKGLLLNRNQFAPIPVSSATSSGPGLPSWQAVQRSAANAQASALKNDAEDGAFTTPPNETTAVVNGYHAEEKREDKKDKRVRKADLEDDSEPEEGGHHHQDEADSVVQQQEH